MIITWILLILCLPVSVFVFWMFGMAAYHGLMDTPSSGYNHEEDTDNAGDN